MVEQTGSTSYPQWGLSWTYDRYGNRSAQTVTAGSAPSNAVTANPATNRISDPGYGYDANGNMTNDGLNSMVYDAENRVVSLNGSTTYAYDGASLRVRKVSGAATTVYIFSGSKVIAEYENGAAPAGPTREYIYSGGALLARIGAVDVRFTNDSCSACVGPPVGGGDRNLFINSITVGSTLVQPNDPSVSYTATPCNGNYGGVAVLACNGDMISTTSAGASAQSITVNAYGSPDYNVYPHMQLLVGGAVVGEWDVTGTAQNYTVTLPTTGIQYYLADHLSVRANTDSNGTKIGEQGHFPYGQNWYESGGTNKLKFTSYERDPESGNDYAMFRYHVNRLGRFNSPDPIAGDISNPQSLNRYAYALNDPINLVDPLGLNVDGTCYGSDNKPIIDPDKRFDTQKKCEEAGGTWVPNINVSVVVNGDTDEVTITIDTFDRPILPETPPEDNYWGTFVKEFFKLSGGPRNVPTCAQQAVVRIVGEFVPYMPTETTVIQATASAAQAVAFNSAVTETHAAIGAHIADRGLTVPLRSSIVRNLAAQGAERAVAAGARANLAVQTVAVDYAAVKSTYFTSKEARNGQCAAAFPIF